MTAAATQREQVEQVRVDDWRNLGDAYQTTDGDGMPVVRLPDSAIVVTALTVDGRLYVYPREFATEAKAAAFAGRVGRAGTIDPERWNYIRGVYGSAAYFTDGWDDFDRGLD